MLRKLSWCLGLLVLLLLVVTQAGAKTVLDIGPSYPGEPSQPSVPGYVPAEVWDSGKTPGGGYAGSGFYYDVIGNRFATDKISIVADGLNPLEIKIWTNNRPGGWTVGGYNWGVADIAINTGPATAAYDDYTLSHFPTAFSRFDYGIDMQAFAQASEKEGKGTVYLGRVAKWETSFAKVNPVAGLKYGGAYLLNATELSPVEVHMLDFSKDYEGTISWVVNDSTLDYNNGIPDYLITITFPDIVAKGEWEFLWATALCANDVVVTPLPGTFWLLGSAFLGLLGIGWRRKS